MGTIIADLKTRFNEGSLLHKLIYINVGMFLAVRLLVVAFTLFKLDAQGFLQLLQLPSSPMSLLYQPWSILTYMILHYEFTHILFNMLWMYWFGNIFLSYFNERQMGGLYLLGGLGGALLYILAYNLFPYFSEVVYHSYLMGASASILAIVVAVAFYAPNVEVNLLIIGRVKIKYIALFTIFLDLLSVTSDNAGGNIAHLGGALVGYLFAERYRKGKDITRFFNRIIDKVVNWFKPSPKLKVTYRRTETDYDYNSRKQSEETELNEILERLKRSGYASLSSDEKKKLFEAGNKKTDE